MMCMRNILSLMKKVMSKYNQQKGKVMKEIIRKSGALALVLIMMMSMASFGFTDPLKPILGVVAEDEIQSIETGTRTNYVLNIKNASYVVATNVRVTITGDHPFRSDVANLTQRVSYINPNETKALEFSVTTSPLAESKNYEFEVLIEYSNYNDDNYSATEKAYVKVVNNNIEPILGVVSYNVGQDAMQAGVPDSLVLRILNTGTISAKDVRIKLSGFSNQGVVLHNDIDIKTVKEIKSKETKMLFFNIIAGKDAVEGSFPVNVTITYIDDMGNRYEKNAIAYVTLAGKGVVDATLEIENLIAPTSVKPNESFEVTFDVTNKGNADITSAEFSFEYPEQFISKSSSRVVIKNLGVDSTQKVTFKMMAKPETPTESYHAYIKASYLAKGATDQTPETIQEYVGIYVEGDSNTDASSSKPKLIVDSYDYGGDYVYAGQDFPLTLNIRNTSASEGTQNIKVTLTSEDNVFTPVDSSSSFFIAKVGPGQVYSHTIYLKTKIDANVKIYTVTAKMEYEDSKGNAYDENNQPYSESEVLSVAVSQPVRLETAEVIVPFEIFAGQPFYIEQEFYNMGKSTMYNMIVKLEVVETSAGSYFVGTFESVNSEYFSAQGFAYEVGSYEGKLVYSFEDALGTISTLEQPFTYNVVEMPNWNEGPGIPMEPEMPVEEKGMPVWQMGLIGLAVLAVAFFIIRKFRKARKNKLELEDLDE